ncbi:MAG: TlpA family protein disulfide reductase [Candidatus Sungbacteria bacterium]|nr:TlpA family protein disulfide reductase [Candidatus Sungbacteria bacterium]
MNAKIIGIIFFILLGAGAALGFGIFSGRAPAPEVREFQSVPQVLLRDYQAREVRLSDFSGKPMLVNAWASWCPYCRDELDDFAAIKKEFARQGKDVVILAVNRAEAPEAAQRYSDALGVSEEIVFLADPDDSFYKAIGGFSMPETVFIDAEGKIRDHRRGAMAYEEIRRRIENAFFTSDK